MGVAWAAVVTCWVSASRFNAFSARLSSLVLMYPDWSRSCIAKILWASNSSDACDGAADGAAPAAPDAPPDPAAPTPLCRCNSATSAQNSANWSEPSALPSALANWRSSDIGGDSCSRFSAAVTSNMLSTPSPLRSNSPNAAFRVSTWCCGGGGGGAAGDGAKVYASDAPARCSAKAVSAGGGASPARCPNETTGFCACLRPSSGNSAAAAALAAEIVGTARWAFSPRSE